MSEIKTWKFQRLMHTDNKFRKSEYAYLARPPVHRVILTQLLVTALLFLILLPAGNEIAISALLGGLCCSIPNAYLVWKTFRHRGARAAKLIAISFYQGEAGKFILTIVAFVMVFTLVKPLEPLALFFAFILVQAVNWFTPLLVKRR